MGYDEFYKARDQITKIIQEDILGPLEKDEVIEEAPISYYLVGKLYPRKVTNIREDNEDDKSFVDAELLSLGNGEVPSAMGMTFAVTSGSKSFLANVESAKYIPIADMKKWQRVPIDYSLSVDIDNLRATRKIQAEIEENLVLQISAYDHSAANDCKVTVTLLNTSETSDVTYRELSQHAFFQPRIEVSDLVNGDFVPLYNASITVDDDETKELELLYHDVQSFAVGHGSSVDWGKNESGKINRVFTETIPHYDLLQMRPADCIDKRYLSMKYLANADSDEMIHIIASLINDYGIWIQTQEKEAEGLREELKITAKANISKCRDVIQRLEKTKNLMRDHKVLEAFKCANRTMLEQRKCMSEKDNIDDEGIKWYPFQLAFILLELNSIVDPDSDERQFVDLLWFPTGGGKTEAYLGIAAFTIFYRRLRLQGDDFGVAVFMRYTLRLLSFQQFERAAAMICAAEFVRKEHNIGGTEFGIGLWAGGTLTPNTISEADDYLRGKTKDAVSPAQLKKCPWCHSQIYETDYSTDTRSKRMHIRCHNDNCCFHSGLPIHLIDEDIYAVKPSFVIGTIDKFAQVAFKEEAGCLLGVDLEAPPELIIQDELHLISGPLGTITGLYEAAITKLCARGNIKPKIIASTATIKNAKEQIKALYGMDYAQFPPQGITVNDSFFACLSDEEKKASRRYMGIMASGMSRALTFNRIMGALLFASRYLIDAGFSEEVIDSFWTETGYFNTLRELGSALSRIVDSVQDRYQYLKNTKFKDKYPFTSGSERYDRYFELTSRQSSNNLGEAIQNGLLIPYKTNSQNRPYDFLVASNMISVGVDVSRLNSMLVVGQPIKTSEYIQSSSRVGRSTPGLVIVEYHPSMVRDRSFYEQFIQFHSSLYKFVEASSLTPFSDRARDRALQALYVILCRYYVPELRGNQDAKNFRKEIPKLEEIRRYILDYVSIVDRDEKENVAREIEDIETVWEDRASHSSDLMYWAYIENDHMLFKKDYLEGDRFRMMNSMRSVEQTINVYVEE